MEYLSKIWRGHFLALVLMVMAFQHSGTYAQTQVRITTNVLPPYSAYVQDYPGTGNRVQVFISNLSGKELSIRLLGKLEGDNGVVIRTSPNYRPLRPLQLRATDVNRLVTRSELEDLFDLAQIEVQGMNKNELYRGLPLPEGNYQLCVQAFDNATIRPLSSEFPMGCSGLIPVRIVEPPILIMPFADEEVLAKTPQTQLFSWSAPVGVNPSQVEYTFRLVELPHPDIDPNVFIDAVVLPRSGVEVKGVRATTLVYGPQYPPLQFGKKYAWCVQAHPLSQQLNFLNEGKSPVQRFTYGQTVKPGIEPTTLSPLLSLLDLGVEKKESKFLSADIAASCECNPIQTQQDMKVDNSKVRVEKKATVANFNIENVSVTESNGKLNGTGMISVPMINNGYIRLIVKLMDVQCNAQGVVIAGKVRGIHKEGVPGMLPGADAPDAPLLQITPQQIQSMGEYFASSKDQLVSNLKSSASSIGFKLPFGIDNGKNAVIAITDMIFTPQGAVFSANSWVPSPSDQISGLPLSGYNLCMTPSKPCGEGVLYLAKKMELTKYFALKGDDDGLAGSAFLKPDTSQVTYAVFDKEGFRKMRIHGLLAPPNLKLVENNGPVEISVNADIEKDFKNWTAQFSFPRFYVEGMKDFKFSMTNGQPALYDHSEATTPGALPAGYETADGHALWKGLYFSEMTIELPDFLKKGEGGDPVTASVKGLIYDDKGFSGKIEVDNILSVDQGSMGGWYFSIDQFIVSFLNSSFQTSQMKGALVLPIFKDPTNKSSRLDYKSTFTSNASEGGLAFEMTAADSSGDMQSEVWKAKLSLRGSSITARYNASTGFVAKAVLNGTIGIDAGPLNIPGATFQGVVLSTAAPYFQVDNFHMGLASPQKEATGLPFNIDPYRTGIENGGTNSPAFRIGGNLDLSEAAGITATGNILLRFNVGNGANGRPDWSYKGVESANFQAQGGVGPVSVSGLIELFQDDPSYGNGFKGNLHMAMLEKFDIEVGAMFGKTTGSDPYRYWYVGGKAKLPDGTSIPLAGPVVFKGFGGGLYSNVLQTVSADTVIYVPEKGKKGFEASVLVGMITPNLLDAEGIFRMNLNGSTVDNINIHADAWFLGTGKTAALATGAFDLNLELAESVFTGKADLVADLAIGPGSISATLPVNLLIDYSGNPGWYFAIGAPTEDGRAQLAVKMGLEATFGSYFVMGSYAPKGWKLPPDPYIKDAALRSLFDGMSGKRKDQSSQAFKSSPENPILAFGAGFSMGHDYNVGPFYMHFAGAVGFDMVLKRLDSPCSASGQIPGINGWYAEGQLYAGMTFALGIDVDLWVYEGRIQVASLSAGALLRGGLVNPIWLNGQVAVRYSVLKGLVKGKFNFDFWYNREHQCDPAFLPPNPFTDMPLISSIGPAGTDTKTSIMTPFTATFNYPVENKMIVEIEIPEGKQVDAGAIGTRIGNTFIQEFKLQFKDRFVAIATQKSGDSNTGTLVMGTNEEGDRNYAATYYRDKALLPNTTYDLTVGIQVYVYNKTKLEPFLFKSKTVEQTEKVSFVTADCPTDLSRGTSDQDMVLTSYPYEGQRYFMKGEPARPFVKLKAALQGCLNGMGSNADYDLQVAFTPLDGSQFAPDQAKSVLLAGAEFTGDQYVYDLPLGLRNNTLYRLQLIRIPKEEFVDQVLAKGFDGQINTKKITTANIYKSTGFSSSSASIQNTQVSPVVSGNKTQVLSGTTKPSVIQNQVDLTYGAYVNTYSDAGKMAQVASDHGLTASVDPQSAASLFKLTQQGSNGLSTMKDLADKREKLRKNLKVELYRYYFKTSKYNTLKDKIGAAKFTTASGAGVGSGIKTGDVVTGSMTVDEGFDRYDLSYEELGYGQFRPPLVLLKATENSAWFKAVARPVAALLSEAPDQYFKDSKYQVNANLLDGTLDAFKRSVVRFSTYFMPTEQPYDNATIYTLFPSETSH